MAAGASPTVGLLSEDPALHDVDIEVDGAAPLVTADAEMLKVVFQNLLINSAHAMQRKGRIRVAVEPVDTECQPSTARLPAAPR